MKPPRCRICDKMVTENEGGLVSFVREEEDIAWQNRMKEIGGTGHPPWLDWFCAEHYDKAQELSHLTIAQAMKIMREKL
jgi:hypothetical protein